MRHSKDILTFLFFWLFAFVIWWVNAAHQQTDTPTADTRHAASEHTVTEQLITEKRLTLPIEVVGVPANKTIRLFPSKADIFARVRVEDYDDLTKEDFRVWCSYPVTQTDVLILHVDVSDGKAMNIRIEPEEAEYLIEDN